MRAKPRSDVGTLRPVGGEISGHLFENTLVGVPRAVYWSCSIQFEPVVAGENEWPASLTFDWIVWPIRRWQELDGRTFGDSNGAIAPEVSLYLFANHQPAQALELSLRHKGLDLFTVRTKVVLNLEMLDGEVVPNFIVDAEAEAALTGLVVVPDNLFPKPDNAEKASKALEPFVDLSAYSAPRFDRFRWVYAPNVVPSA